MTRQPDLFQPMLVRVTTRQPELFTADGPPAVTRDLPAVRPVPGVDAERISLLSQRPREATDRSGRRGVGRLR